MGSPLERIWGNCMALMNEFAGTEAMDGVYIVAWALLCANVIALLAQKLSFKWQKDQKQALKIWFWIGAFFGIPSIIFLILIKKISRDTDEEILDYNIRNSILTKYSITLVALLLVTYAIFNVMIKSDYDDRTSREKALDTYCEKQGRSGCSDTLREIKRLTDH